MEICFGGKEHWSKYMALGPPCFAALGVRCGRYRKGLGGAGMGEEGGACTQRHPGWVTWLWQALLCLGLSWR